MGSNAKHHQCVLIDWNRRWTTSSQEEVEELTALYDSEKSQNQALEEAVAAEKENFNKV